MFTGRQRGQVRLQMTDLTVYKAHYSDTRQMSGQCVTWQASELLEFHAFWLYWDKLRF